MAASSEWARKMQEWGPTGPGVARGFREYEVLMDDKFS
jgi:hypothetical protein